MGARIFVYERVNRMMVKLAELAIVGVIQPHLADRTSEALVHSMAERLAGVATFKAWAGCSLTSYRPTPTAPRGRRVQSSQLRTARYLHEPPPRIDPATGAGSPGIRNPESVTSPTRMRRSDRWASACRRAIAR